MTLYEFNVLPFEDKLKAVWNKGTFLDNHVTTEKRINCYALDKFFVDLTYDSKSNSITEIKSFKTGHRLEKYSPNINPLI